MPTHCTQQQVLNRHAQVNAALDDAASMAEDMARLLSAARGKGKLTAAERRRAQALMVSVAVRPELMQYPPNEGSRIPGLLSNLRA